MKASEYISYMEEKLSKVKSYIEENGDKKLHVEINDNCGGFYGIYDFDNVNEYSYIDFFDFSTKDDEIIIWLD